MLISATQGTGVEKGGHIYTALSRSSLDAFLRNASCVSVKRLQGLITWLDTFDLRLLRAGNRLYLHKNELYFKSAIEIYPDVMKIRRRPAFSDDFSDPAFRRQIEPVMGNRVLAPLIAGGRLRRCPARQRSRSPQGWPASCSRLPRPALP